MILALSTMMQNAISNWRRLGHNIDARLLKECSYYPKAGCQHCSFDNPNQDCSRSHILTLTSQLPKFESKSQCDLTSPSYSSQLIKEKKGEKRKVWGVSLEDLWKYLPDEVKHEVEIALKGGD